MALQLSHSTFKFFVPPASCIICVFLTDGTRVASSTGIDLLLLDDFKLIINDVSYHVRPPKRGKAASSAQHGQYISVFSSLLHCNTLYCSGA